MLNKILNFLFPIVTPGVLIVGFLTITQLLDGTITWERFSFAAIIFIGWGFAFYRYKKNKKEAQNGHRQ